MTQLTFLGAAQSVTGSRFLLATDSSTLLVDCGLSQERSLQEKNWEPLPLPADRIDEVLLTHAHLDHICNNGLIAVVETKTKHHYLLCGGIDSAQLDAPGALRRAVHPDGGNLRGNLRSTVELPDRPLQVPVYDRFRQLPNRLVARK